MTSIPFVTKPSTKANDEIIELGNDKIGKIKIKKLGCLTLNESREIDSLLDKLIQASDKKPVSTSNELKLNVVNLAFQTRVVFPTTNEKGEANETTGNPEWSLADTENNYNEIYEEIYDFFYLKERSRWKDSNFLTKIEGDDAELIAKTYAESNGLTSVSDGNAWYVFSSEEEIGDGYIKPNTEATGRKGRGK